MMKRIAMTRCVDTERLRAVVQAGAEEGFSPPIGNGRLNRILRPLPMPVRCADQNRDAENARHCFEGIRRPGMIAP